MRVSLTLVLITATSLPFHSVRSESLFANRETSIVTGGVALICLILGTDSYIRARHLEKKQFPTPQEKKDRKKLKTIAGILGSMSAASALAAIASTIAYLRKPVQPALRLRLERMPSGDILLTPEPSPQLPVFAARPASPRRPNASAEPNEWVIYLRELAQWMRDLVQHDPVNKFDLLLSAQQCEHEAEKMEHNIKMLAEKKKNQTDDLDWQINVPPTTINGHVDLVSLCSQSPRQNNLFVSPVSARTASTPRTPASTPAGWWPISPFTPRSAARK